VRRLPAPHPSWKGKPMPAETDADPYGLRRFVEAQHGSYDRALAEITRGRKTSHWMWFVFPQLAGLGHSDMARRYAVASLDEARAFLAHPFLGARYRACVEALGHLPATTATAVFGPVDAAKLRSSLTLFALAAPGEALFAAALDRWFGGNADARTAELLATTGPGSAAPA